MVRYATALRLETLLVQQVLVEPAWAKKLTDEDRRGLTALFWSNVNPYGTFRLDMDKRLDLGLVASAPGGHRQPINHGGAMKDFQNLTDPGINEAAWRGTSAARLADSAS
ncbi:MULTISPECIES: hypothetical protein [unclassified Streptomyces]|uniref:hypothetical protein n=1 Tax=unclassified Streptomyces TaxID=2593676 RepID=UPI002252C041|nr:MULTISPECIES: hypothetical protein [unclassified Streptomyces]WSP57884.1 transposase [Streptomyces sp. NBC_01241]WSU21378.1 transposase [Streptomyces sp. NBC_01108]WTE36608.1 transposase [Streptomyces sp. NBC_01618]MCX4789800.1 transposase [Streptomyces sp. NBC_01221]MCX4794498.1 transposase [Streptomyces sp. NBC_01242]